MGHRYLHNWFLKVYLYYNFISRGYICSILVSYVAEWRISIFFCFKNKWYLCETVKNWDVATSGLRWMQTTFWSDLQPINLDSKQLTNSKQINELRSDRCMQWVVYKIKSNFNVPVDTFPADAAILLATIFQRHTKPCIRFETAHIQIRTSCNHMVKSLTYPYVRHTHISLDKR